MNKYLLFIIFLYLGLFSNASNFPVTELINYQGRVVDGSGLISRQVNLVIRLYDDIIGGSLLLEDIGNVTVIDSLYSTYIGDNITQGSYDLVKSATNVYISIEMDGQLFIPREKLTSVMSSIKSDVSNTSKNISNDTIFVMYIGTNVVGWGRKK